MSEKYHEVLRPVREIGELVVGWAKDIICPPDAVEWTGGASEMLDEGMSAPRSVPPANPGER